MTQSVMRVGVMSPEAYKRRTLEIARGERERGDQEPLVWFDSLKTLSEVLSDRNRALLGLIEAHQPQSLAELERLSGRKRSSLSRTLRTMERYGVVEIHRERNRVAPRAKATRFQVDLSTEADIA